jgi:hypothetical protein
MRYVSALKPPEDTENTYSFTDLTPAEPLRLQGLGERGGGGGGGVSQVSVLCLYSRRKHFVFFLRKSGFIVAIRQL